MAKNFGKIILGAVTISAAVAGVYYYFTQKDHQYDLDFDDEDFDAFDADFDHEASRNYTTLDQDTASSDATDTTNAATTPSSDHCLVQEAGEIAANASKEIKEANHIIENFFDDESK